jgi:hypothetical protein
MVPESHFGSESDLGRYGTLLEMADFIVHHPTLPELFRELAERLRRATQSYACLETCFHPVVNLPTIRFEKRCPVAMEHKPATELCRNWGELPNPAPVMPSDTVTDSCTETWILTQSGEGDCLF